VAVELGWDCVAVLFAELVDLDEVLFDGFAGQVRLDELCDVIPRDGDAVLGADVVDAEEDELIEIGW